MIILIVVLVVIVGLLGLVFRALLGADSNSGVTLGTNNPYPDSVGILGGEDPPYLPTPVISEREEFVRDAGRKLAALQPRSHSAPARSWMDEPGAIEAAGLADETQADTALT